MVPAENCAVKQQETIAPLPAAVNVAWDKVGDLHTTIDYLSQRLVAVINPAPVPGGNACASEQVDSAPLTESIKRLGNSVADAREKLAMLIKQLDL
ncbi:hypothetical protein [Klebsiella pasteurii]|uniref:hypothetical protein n=1 Tax=Klebsiella pasteurii TaxID=2587529 RepID=UPI0035CF06D9